ncbi:MAG TPA: DUF2017 domain-containing protein [Sporichthyaceae bacterium]|nr:DUF2017 domain-containing protein [Sporichthyaceae bacterium]
MSASIKRERDGVVVLTLGSTEVRVVRNAFGDLLALFDTHQRDGGPVPEIAPGVLDPFGAPASGEAPTDPALARLLPDAYSADPAAAAEYRRFTEGDLLAAKRANAGVVLAGLAEAERSGHVRLDGETVHIWLIAINDVRLTLGTRLEIEEDYEALIDQLEPDDPRLPGFALYEWLTALQETLVAHAA